MKKCQYGVYFDLVLAQKASYIIADTFYLNEFTPATIQTYETEEECKRSTCIVRVRASAQGCDRYLIISNWMFSAHPQPVRQAGLAVRKLI